jgi:hypothetical protein
MTAAAQEVARADRVRAATAREASGIAQALRETVREAQDLSVTETEDRARAVQSPLVTETADRVRAADVRASEEETALPETVRALTAERMRTKEQTASQEEDMVSTAIIVPLPQAEWIWV